MTETDSLHEELDRGQRAQRILEDPLFTEAFISVVDDLNMKLIDSPAAAQDFREVCYHGLQGSRLFMALLTRHVQTGELARTTLDQIAEEKDGWFKKSTTAFDRTEQFI